MVRIRVSQPAWEEYLSYRSAIGKILHNFTVAISRKRGIYLPAQQDADDIDLVDLINFFASGSNTA